jgi:p-aminobenzoyl-glutamate transporter AbgT
MHLLRLMENAGNILPICIVLFLVILSTSLIYSNQGHTRRKKFRSRLKTKDNNVKVHASNH